MKLKTAFLATTALLAAGNVMAVEASVYGQVNKLAAYVDNENSDSAIVDNATSASRFGIKSQQQLDNGLTVSALLEFGSASNPSDRIEFIDDENEEDDSYFEERHARIGLASEFGTFLIGKTSEVNDGITEIDLAGVQDVMFSDINAIGGSVLFVRKDGTATTVKISDAYSNLDGIRTNLVRYDTPIYNGASAGVSLTSGGDIAVALKYEGYATDALKLKAGAAYKKHNAEDQSTYYDTDKNVDDDFAGSISAKHETSGVAGTFAIGNRTFKDTGEKDSSFWYGKLSYAPVATNFEFAVDYARGDNANTETGNVKSYGIGGQYNIAEGVSTSLMYRHVKGSTSLTAGDKTNNIDFITGGLRVSF